MNNITRYAATIIAPATRPYTSGEWRYLDFCRLHRLEASPTPDLIISSFAAYLTRFVKPGTIRAYLSAVRNLHIELGIPDPFLDTPLLQRVMRGICRVHGTAVEKTRLPVTMPVLKGLIHALQSSQAYTAHDKAMLSAAMLLAFFGFLRCGEFTAPASKHHLDGAECGDVKISLQPPSLPFFLKHSKTDPEKRGMTIHIGSATPPVCPVIAMITYFSLSPALPSDPLFKFQDGSPLHRARFVDIVRKLLVAVGVHNQDHYAGHSFRIGAATTAALCGTPEWMIRAMGRWRSDCVHCYIRTAPTMLQAVSAQMAAVH